MVTLPADPDGPASARAAIRFAPLGLAIATLVVALLGAEMGLRRLYPFGEVLAAPDAQLIYRPVPSHRGLFRCGDGSHVRVETNALGLRGPEVGPKSAARTRIAVYGDSLVQAFDTPLRATFPVLLQRELDRRGAPVEALNAGVMGYGPDQSLLKFEGEVERLQPDLVVLVLCAHNDAKNVADNRLFELDERGLLVQRRPRLRPRIVQDYERRLGNARRPVLWRLLEAALAETDTGPPDPAPNRAEQLGDFTPLLQQRVKAILGRFAASCRARQADLVAVVVPSSLDLIPGHAGSDPELDYPRAAMSGIFTALLGDVGVPCLDLFGPYRELGARGLFLPDDIHWSPAGHRVTAELVANLLVERGLVDGTDGSGDG